MSPTPVASTSARAPTHDRAQTPADRAGQHGRSNHAMRAKAASAVAEAIVAGRGATSDGQLHKARNRNRLVPDEHARQTFQTTRRHAQWLPFRITRA